MASPTVRQRLILQEGTFLVEKVELTDIGPQEDLLRSLLSERPMLVTRIADIGGQRLHLIRTKTEEMLFTRLVELPFRSAFIVNRNADNLVTGYTPTFRPVPTSSETEVCFRDQAWSPPAEMSLLFGVVRTLNNPTRVPMSRVMLAGVEDTEFVDTFYPNVYIGNGHVCMGEEFINSQQVQSALNTSFTTFFITALSHFMSTEMNRDLVSENTYRYFSRNNEGRWSIHSMRRRPRQTITSSLLVALGEQLKARNLTTSVRMAFDNL